MQWTDVSALERGQAVRRAPKNKTVFRNQRLQRGMLRRRRRGRGRRPARAAAGRRSPRAAQADRPLRILAPNRGERPIAPAGGSQIADYSNDVEIDNFRSYSAVIRRPDSGANVLPRLDNLSTSGGPGEASHSSPATGIMELGLSTTQASIIHDDSAVAGPSRQSAPLMNELPPIGIHSPAQPGSAATGSQIADYSNDVEIDNFRSYSAVIRRPDSGANVLPRLDNLNTSGGPGEASHSSPATGIMELGLSTTQASIIHDVSAVAVPSRQSAPLMNELSPIRNNSPAHPVPRNSDNADDSIDVDLDDFPDAADLFRQSDSELSDEDVSDSIDESDSTIESNSVDPTSARPHNLDVPDSSARTNSPSIEVLEDAAQNLNGEIRNDDLPAASPPRPSATFTDKARARAYTRTAAGEPEMCRACINYPRQRRHGSSHR
ncbi:unnamed protein product, partial [Trichogramma brassicae]